jgi:SH3-like domain-containing protein
MTLAHTSEEVGLPESEPVLKRMLEIVSQFVAGVSTGRARGLPSPRFVLIIPHAVGMRVG